NVRQPDYDNYDFFKEIRSELGEHLVIKPNNQGSSIGVSIVNDGNLDEIYKGIKIASEYSRLVLVEQFIGGREITVGIIGEEALPVIEIVTQDGFYDYSHKYSMGHTEYVCPAEITEDISDFAQSLAVSSFISLGCSGFARSDFRLNEDGQPFLMEINTIPGFTSTSLVPMAAKEVGIDFPDLCEKIIQLALED
ncbi:MAG: ATP-grasp domain-containing protein, partial [Ignavibacteria bacterium]|nr:ATP-grasp domain-containing protein [Ignavibacteria bacterium]